VIKAFKLTALLSLILVISCGIYTFSPSALGGLKSIAIPVFENKTTEYGLDDLLTQEVTQLFLDDNSLKIVPEAEADVILYGAISSYSHEPYTFDVSESVQEYICELNLNIKIQYTDSDKILWEDENLSDYGVYSIIDGQTQSDGNQEAIEKLAVEILNRTVKDW